MTVLPVSATLVVGGNDLSQYIRSTNRRASFCNVGQSLDITLEWGAPFASLDPFDAVTFDEVGTRVFTGYLNRKESERPDHVVRLFCSDTWKLALETFIEETDWIANGESVGYWIGRALDYAGLSYRFPSSGSTLSVGKSLPLGSRSVADCVRTLVPYAGWAIRVDPYGVVEFLNSAEDTRRNFGQIYQGVRTLDDQDTRTQANVWGWDITTGSQLFIARIRPVAGISPERKMLFVIPSIDTAEKAERLAAAALNQYASLTDKLNIHVPASPNYQVGEIGEAGFDGNFSNLITEINTDISPQGYTASVNMGRPCLALPAFPIGDYSSGSMAYCLTANFFGRTRDWTSGSAVNWENISGLLPSTNLWWAEVDPFNPDSIAFCSTGSGLWRTTSISSGSPPAWSQVYTNADFLADTGFSLTAFRYIRGTAAARGVWHCLAQSGLRLYVGTSEDYGESFTWTWVVSLAGATSQIGFDVSDTNADYVWTSGSIGQVWGTSTARNPSPSWTLLETLVDAQGAATTLHVPRHNNAGHGLVYGSYPVSVGNPVTLLFTFDADTENWTPSGGYGMAWSSSVGRTANGSLRGQVDQDWHVGTQFPGIEFEGSEGTTTNPGNVVTNTTWGSGTPANLDTSAAIYIDLGASYEISGLDFYWVRNGGTSMRVRVYVSETLTFGSFLYEVNDADNTPSSPSNSVSATGRYIRFEFFSSTGVDIDLYSMAVRTVDGINEYWQYADFPAEAIVLATSEMSAYIYAPSITASATFFMEVEYSDASLDYEEISISPSSSWTLIQLTPSVGVGKNIVAVRIGNVAGSGTSEGYFYIDDVTINYTTGVSAARLFRTYDNFATTPVNISAFGSGSEYAMLIDTYRLSNALVFTHVTGGVVIGRLVQSVSSGENWSTQFLNPDGPNTCLRVDQHTPVRLHYLSNSYPVYSPNAGLTLQSQLGDWVSVFGQGFTGPRTLIVR